MTGCFLFFLSEELALAVVKLACFRSLVSPLLELERRVAVLDFFLPFLPPLDASEDAFFAGAFFLGADCFGCSGC